MRSWLILLGLLGGLSAHADAPVWAIRGAHNTVYLAGSIHLLKAGDAQLPAAFDRAYASAAALVMEIDLDDLNPLDAQGWMLEHGTLPEDKTLRAALGEARYRRISAETQRLGLPLEGLEQFKPWAIALTLTELEYMQLGFDPEQGVEKQLQRRAQVDHKEITGLETLQEQLGLLDGLSDEDQAHFLDLAVDDMHDMGAQTAGLMSAWRNGDTGRLATMLSEEYRTFPALYRTLVSDRNRRWMPQLEHLLHADKDYLVVVGALHLVGSGGLLELARAKGFEPRQMP